MADDVVIFMKEDLPNLAFPAMEQIRRQGKLCDVTIKVIVQLYIQCTLIIKCKIFQKTAYIFHSPSYM